MEVAAESPAGDALRHEIARRLAEARARTLLLTAVVPEDDLRRQHDPLMGPVIWDLGHIAHFEQLWLVDNTRGEIRFSEMPGMFNPFENPRSVRGGLDLPSRADAIDLLATIRRNVLANLEATSLENGSPLMRDGFVYNMVLQHEYQHDETILQTMQLKQGAPYAAPRATPLPESSFDIAPGSTVRFQGGRVILGTNDRTEAYDNERPAHEVDVAPFEIDVTPVTREDYLAFMDDGGYTRRELWSDAGWTWLRDAEVESPKYWFRENGEWRVRTMDRVAPAAARVPVCHVCWFEADAWARWAGRRLPTEIEWEVAASWDPVASVKRKYPWGDTEPGPIHANLDQLTFDVATVGTYPLNVSPIGCHGMIGDVWEWTASDFDGWPGFEAWPYPEYSEAFFGNEYKVLRGGSWATRSGAVRNTFRNWDYPIRRQIFSGFRCARDA
jgi:iron(II)-dependent oxidoreductase